jgi:hypothetical protein
MDSRDAELVIETWRFRERALPRVPPTGWATTDRLREAVCLAVACSVDGVERVEPFEGPASERERFDAAVTADSIDHDCVSLLTPPGGDGVADGNDATDGNDGPAGRDEGFAERTEQFELDDALDRL